MQIQRKHKPGFTSIALGKAWCEAIELQDGRRLLLRPIQPSDAVSLQRSFQTLSAHDVRMRFMHPMKELTADYARKLVEINPDRGFALVLVEAKPPPEALIAAVARTALDDDGLEAEFAIILGQEIRGLGLGHYMMEKLIEWSRTQELQAIYGYILCENLPMKGLAEKLGFEIGLVASSEDSDTLLARLRLN